MDKIQKLEPGDRIGVFSSSSPTTQEALRRLENYFSQRGFEVIVAPNTLAEFGYIAGLPEKRASDFNWLLKDPGVKAIITATGGKGAIQILPFINFDAVRQHPKIICGLSDPTTLLNAITHKSGIPTFHGPNGYNFGHTVPSKFTETNWWEIVCGSFTIPYRYPLPNYNVLKTSHDELIEGKIFGGNLGVLVNVIGTPYEPPWEGTILFIEERIVDISKTDIMLTQLQLAGVFDKIKGLVVGQYVELQSNPHESFEDMLLRNAKEFDFPIITNVLLGHTEDKITIPIGCKFGLDLVNKHLLLLDSPFAN